MSYFAARKWYYASILAAVAAICAKFVADYHASAVSLAAAAWKREPARYRPAVVLLILAGAFQLLVV